MASSPSFVELVEGRSAENSFRSSAYMRLVLAAASATCQGRAVDFVKHWDGINGSMVHVNSWLSIDGMKISLRLLGEGQQDACTYFGSEDLVYSDRLHFAGCAEHS